MLGLGPDIHVLRAAWQGVDGRDKPGHDAGDAVVLMRGLTDGCNACHSSMDRSFIAIGVPTGGQPTANQIFSPSGGGRTK